MVRSRARAEGAFALAGLASLAGLAAALALLLPPLPTAPLYAGAGAPDDRPRRGGTFVCFHESDVRGLDPHLDNDGVSNVGLKLLFETLVEHTPDLEIVPRLAREMPSVGEDGLVYTFRLRENVRFHNGRALLADDVRWSMERMLHPDTGSPGAPFYALIEGVDDYQAGRATHVRGIRVLDEHTVEFRLTRPDQTFLHTMALLFAAPVPRENVERWGPDVRRHPIGTGAFVLQEWEPGVRITFRRNPDFFLPGQPYVERIVYELNLSRGAAFLRFQGAQIDHIHRFTPTDYLFFRSLAAWRPYTATHPLVDVWGLQMNTELPPFDDVHVRRAVAFAIDRDRWNVARANRLLPTGQPIPRALPGHDPDLPGAHRLDLSQSRREMELAGHPVRCTASETGTERCVADGIDEVELWIGEGPTGQAYGVLAQQDLAAIGIAVRLRPASFPVYLEQTGRPRTVQMLFGGWSMDFPDPASFLEPLFHSRSATARNASNRSFYRNPALDALLDRARSEPDRDRRAALYREASRILVQDAPWAFLFSNVKVEAWQPYVRGFRPHPVWDELYRDVWLDLPRRRLARAMARGPSASFAALAPFGGWR